MIVETMLKSYFNTDISRILPASLILFTLLSSLTLGVMLGGTQPVQNSSRDFSIPQNTFFNKSGIADFFLTLLPKTGPLNSPDENLAPDISPTSRLELVYGSSHEWDNSLYVPSYKVESVEKTTLNNTIKLLGTFSLTGFLVFLIFLPYVRNHTKQLSELKYLAETLPTEGIKTLRNTEGQLSEISNSFYRAISDTDQRLKENKTLLLQNSNQLNRAIANISQEPRTNLIAALKEINALSKTLAIISDVEKKQRLLERTPVDVLDTLKDIASKYPKLEVLGTPIVVTVDRLLFEYMMISIVDYASSSPGTPVEIELVQSHSVIQISIINSITVNDRVIPYYENLKPADATTFCEPRINDANFIMAQSIAQAHDGEVSFSRSPFPIITATLPLM